MKKIFLLLLITIFVSTGCGTKKMICKKEEVDENNLKLTKTAIIKYNDTEVTDIKMELNYELEAIATSMCEALKTDSSNIECNKNVITIKDYQKSISEETLNKENAKIYFEDQEFTCE